MLTAALAANVQSGHQNTPRRKRRLSTLFNPSTEKRRQEREANACVGVLRLLLPIMTAGRWRHRQPCGEENTLQGLGGLMNLVDVAGGSDDTTKEEGDEAGLGKLLLFCASAPPDSRAGRQAYCKGGLHGQPDDHTPGGASRALFFVIYPEACARSASDHQFGRLNLFGVSICRPFLQYEFGGVISRTDANQLTRLAAHDRYDLERFMVLVHRAIAVQRPLRFHSIKFFIVAVPATTRHSRRMI